MACAASAARRRLHRRMDRSRNAAVLSVAGDQASRRRRIEIVQATAMKTHTPIASTTASVRPASTAHVTLPPPKTSVTTSSPITKRRIMRVSRSTRSLRSRGSGATDCHWARHDSSSTSFIVAPQELAQHLSRTRQSRTHIGFADPKYFSDLRITHTLERQRDDLRVADGQLPNRFDKACAFLLGRESPLRIWPGVLKLQFVIGCDRRGTALRQIRDGTVMGNPKEKGPLGRFPSKPR